MFWLFKYYSQHFVQSYTMSFFPTQTILETHQLAVPVININATDQDRVSQHGSFYCVHVHESIPLLPFLHWYFLMIFLLGYCDLLADIWSERCWWPVLLLHCARNWNNLPSKTADWLGRTHIHGRLNMLVCFCS